jgi:hypothetical protein
VPEGDTGVLPATCFNVTEGQVIDCDAIRARRGVFLEQNDAFHLEYLRLVIFNGANANEVKLTQSARDLLQQWGLEGAQISNTP